MKLNNFKLPAILDSGAFNTILSRNILDKIFKGKNVKLSPYHGRVLNASGHVIPILGLIKTKVVTPVSSFLTKVLIYEYNSFDSKEHSVLLGMDILRNSIMNFKDRKINFSIDNGEYVNQEAQLTISISDEKILGGRLDSSEEILNTTCVDQCTPGTSKTGLLEEANGARPKSANISSSHPATDHAREVHPSNSCSTSPEGSISAISHVNTQVEEVSINSSLYLNHELNVHGSTMTTVMLPVRKGIVDETELILAHNNTIASHMIVPNMIVKVVEGKVPVNIVNFDSRKITLPPGTKICDVLNVRQRCNKVNAISKSDNVVESKHETYRPLTLDDINCDDRSKAVEILDRLNRYRHTCWLEGEKLGLYKGDELRIKIKSGKVVHKQPYPIPHIYQEVIFDLNDVLTTHLLLQG